MSIFLSGATTGNNIMGEGSRESFDDDLRVPRCVVTTSVSILYYNTANAVLLLYYRRLPGANNRTVVRGQVDD